jgi:hypothetical protein
VSLDVTEFFFNNLVVNCLAVDDQSHGMKCACLVIKSNGNPGCEYAPLPPS